MDLVVLVLVDVEHLDPIVLVEPLCQHKRLEGELGHCKYS